MRYARHKCFESDEGRWNSVEGNRPPGTWEASDSLQDEGGYQSKRLPVEDIGIMLVAGVAERNVRDARRYMLKE